MRWLSQRRFNRIDIMVISIGAATISHGQWWIGLGVLFIGAVASELIFLDPR